MPHMHERVFTTSQLSILDTILNKEIAHAEHVRDDAWARAEIGYTPAMVQIGVDELVALRNLIGYQ